MNEILSFPAAVVVAASAYFVTVISIVLTIVFFKIFISARQKSQKRGPP